MLLIYHARGRLFVLIFTFLKCKSLNYETRPPKQRNMHNKSSLLRYLGVNEKINEVV